MEGGIITRGAYKDQRGESRYNQYTPSYYDAGLIPVKGEGEGGSILEEESQNAMQF